MGETLFAFWFNSVDWEVSSILNYNLDISFPLICKLVLTTQVHSWPRPYLQVWDLRQSPSCQIGPCFSLLPSAHFEKPICSSLPCRTWDFAHIVNETSAGKLDQQAILACVQTSIHIEWTLLPHYGCNYRHLLKVLQSLAGVTSACSLAFLTCSAIFCWIFQ